jgi:hypothetical protein
MATKLGGRVPDLSGTAGPSNRAAVKTGGPAGNRWMEERMNITTIGRGNVGGALARRWGGQPGDSVGRLAAERRPDDHAC